MSNKTSFYCNKGIEIYNLGVYGCFSNARCVKLMLALAWMGQEFFNLTKSSPFNIF